MADAPRSKIFDDVYFCPDDGLAETRHVFLDGNGLPETWAGGENFVIGETGFGTGLNFLAVWKLFLDSAQVDQSLHFISVEKYPLSAVEIDEALGQWPELNDLRAQLVAAYPDDPSGVLDAVFHDGRVRVTVYFGDVVAALSCVETKVDAWFLDGFRPSSNPEMWSDDVFAQMARLSDAGTRFATFTSAGFVRRGLAAAGFDVRKVAGYGRKREMSIGEFRCG